MFLYYLRKLPSDYALISDSFGSVRKPCGHNILKKFQYCNVRIQILLRHYKLSMSDNRLIGYQYYNGSVVILGGLIFVTSIYAYTFASLKRKNLISTTPLNDALNALILSLNASAAAFVLLFTKKFKILS